MTKIIIVISILLFPLQNLSLFLMGSRYDLTAFLLLWVAIHTIIVHGISKRTLFFTYIFFLVQLILFAFLNIAPYYRFISGLIWLGGLILLLFEGEKIKYDQMQVFFLIILVLSLSSLYLFFQYFVLGLIRPSAWFREPSFAGLCLYSAAAGLLVSISILKLKSRIRFFIILLVIVFFCAGVLTLSLHFITFLISISLISLLLFSGKFFAFNFKRTLLFITFSGLLFLITSQLFMMDHYSSRINLNAPTNLSLLAWLRGYDQMIASIFKSPIFGCGLGSTGFFEFKSENSAILESVGLGNLCLTDAFSLAFRLVIEIGLPFFMLFCFFLLKRLKEFKKHIKNIQNISTRDSFPVIFNFVFSISVLLGCFLKEPLYPQSYLYLSILLVSSIPLSLKSTN